jgi:DNA-binding MarR family transcriptional regulator
MLDQTFTSLADFFGAVGRGFMLPGDLLLSAFAWLAPKTVEILTFGTGKMVVTFVLALVGWTIVLITGLILSRLCRGIAWQIASIFRTLVWRAKMFVGTLKTKMLWKWRQFFPHKEAQAHSVSQDEIDELDIAVMVSLSRCGSGMATTASGLAKQYKLKQAEIQQRLDRLKENHMLRSAISPNDGHEKYRLTDSGLAYLAMCERQASARVNLTSASVSG